MCGHANLPEGHLNGYRTKRRQRLAVPGLPCCGKAAWNNANRTIEDAPDMRQARAFCKPEAPRETIGDACQAGNRPQTAAAAVFLSWARWIRRFSDCASSGRRR